MSILTSLFTGVSGLNANGQALSVVGDNIANSNTVGFKGSRTTFQDMLSSASGGSSSMQIGRGVQMQSVMTLFSQGTFETTNNPLDLAIQGEGFFMAADADGDTLFTRAGQFVLDKDGYIVNPEGLKLMGNAAGATGEPEAITVSNNQQTPPNSTTEVIVNTNLQNDATVKGFIFTAATNEDISFTIDGGATIVADLITHGGLSAGTTYSGTQVAAAIKQALEAQNGIADTYTVSFDGNSGKFTITGATGNTGTLVLDWDGASTAADLLGFTADSTITAGVSDTSDVTGGAFSVTDAANTSNYSTSITVYDDQGGSHLLNVYFRKSSVTNTGNSWSWYAVVDGADNGNSASDQVQAEGTLSFATGGALADESVITYATGGFDFNNGVTQNQLIDFDFGSSVADGGTGLTGSTQFGSASIILSQSQDGYGPGFLKSLVVDQNGVLMGAYTNGQTQEIATIKLAKFAAPTELLKVGRNLYREAAGSGEHQATDPGTSGVGTILGNSLEMSNVDLAEEFVKMIAFQRGFQANTRVITATDDLLNEVMAIKR